jgi:hypothetical protein
MLDILTLELKDFVSGNKPKFIAIYIFKNNLA